MTLTKLCIIIGENHRISNETSLLHSQTQVRILPWLCREPQGCLGYGPDTRICKHGVLTWVLIPSWETQVSRWRNSIFLSKSCPADSYYSAGMTFDTNCLESGLMAEGAVLRKAALTLDASHTVRVPRPSAFLTN